MASKRSLKRDINYVIGEIIEVVLLHQAANPEAENGKSDEIIDEAISDFDQLISKVNQRDVENSKEHFKSIRKELEVKAEKLVERVNTL